MLMGGLMVEVRLCLQFSFTNSMLCFISNNVTILKLPVRISCN